MILIQCVSLRISSCPTHSSDTHCLTRTHVGISLAALRASNDLVDTIISSHIRGMETLTCPEPFASTTAGFSTTCTSLLQDMLNSVSTGCASVFDLAPTRQEFIFVRCVQSSSEPTHLPPTPVPTSERTCHIVLSNTAIDCVRCAQHDVHHARRTASVELQFVRTLPSVPYPSMRSPFIRSPSFPTCTDSRPRIATNCAILLILFVATIRAIHYPVSSSPPRPRLLNSATSPCVSSFLLSSRTSLSS